MKMVFVLKWWLDEDSNGYVKPGSNEGELNSLLEHGWQLLGGFCEKFPGAEGSMFLVLEKVKETNEQ